MDDLKIVCGLLTYNEELYIKYAIGALYKTVDAFVVVDSGSTDKTIPLLKEMDVDQKITILQRPWDNSYCNARNHYLKFIRDYIWNPDMKRLYYWRLDPDEIYFGNLGYMKSYIDKNRDKSGFRFHMATFDTTHFTLNEVNPKETRANLFLYSPFIKYVNDIHEMPIAHNLTFQQPLYGAKETDQELNIQEVSPDVAAYCHFAYCDEQRCAKKMFNYTEHYVKKGLESQERLNDLYQGKNWAWNDHKSNLFANNLAYPKVLKGAPFLNNPPFDLIFEDGSKMLKGTSEVLEPGVKVEAPAA